MDTFGYTWEPYTVETEDGWYLSMFRMTGVVGEPEIVPDYTRPPILLQSGAFTSEEDWWGLPVLADIPGKLLRSGYDVFVTSIRGTTYSNVNRRDGEWSLKERWNFDWSDMGYYDIPAWTDKILEVTG